MSICFCTLAIHPTYRERARLLCRDAPDVPWVVLTDVPADFADLPVRAVAHEATGPMAIDYVLRIGPTGNNQGAAAYHDKRFALQAALEQADTAIFLDADSRLAHVPVLPALPPGLAVLPVVRNTVAGHLSTCGTWRRPAFTALAREVFGDETRLTQARWCHETCYAVTKDGREGLFFDAWDRAARWMQEHHVFSGEGGVMGLAALHAGWGVDDECLVPLGAALRHGGGGPKRA